MEASAATATATAAVRPPLTSAKPPTAAYPQLSQAAKDALLAATAKTSGSTAPVEDVDARTAYSTTTVDPESGTNRTVISPDAVNYRDSVGAWKPVDNDLVSAAAKAGGASTGWQNTAAGYDAAFPTDLTKPVTITDQNNAARWVSLQLTPTQASAAAAPAAATTASTIRATSTRSLSTASAVMAAAPAEPVPVASAPGVVAGAEVSYDNVLPGAGVSYQAQGSGVKEAITLDSAAALPGGALTYTLRTGKDLVLTEADDAIAVTTTAGAPVFVIPAPFLDDAKGAHSDDVDVTITPDAAAGAGAYAMTVTPSKDWLAVPERAWPVVLDPTIQYPDPMLACSLRSAAPTVSNCSASSVPLSWDSSTGTQERAILRFESLFDAVPADAIIADAELQLNVASPASGTTAPTGAAASVDVRELTKYYEPGASWNQATNTVAWATPGADRAGLVSGRTQVTSNGTYQNFNVSELVQRWVEGTSTSNGFVLEKTSATAGGARVTIGSPYAGSSAAPKLQIIWDARVGDRKGNSALLTEQLDDRTSVTVNPATGNAAVSTFDLAIAGVGLDLDVANTSNSLSTDGLTASGYGWHSSITDAHLQRYGKTTFYRDGAGTNWTFYQAVDGTWVRPLGLDADLVQNANGTFTLTDRRSKVVTSFIDIGSPAGEWYTPASITDRNGNAITFTYDASARLPYNGWKILRSVTDTRGRVLTVANGGAYNAYLQDAAGRSVSYTITNDNLTKVTNGAGGNTAYTYDAAHRVTSITVPEGQRTELTYDAGGRVLTLKRITTDVGTKTWTFAYTDFTRSSTGAPATKATVTDPNGHNTVYTSDGRGRVADATDARGKKRSSTYTPNDDTATSTGATAGSGGASSPQTTTNTYDATGATPQAATWNLSAARVPTGAGVANTYGTGTRLYDVMSSTDARGNASTFAYDSAGNQTSATKGGVTTKSLYQGNTDPDYGGTVNCGPTVNSTVTATKAGVLCETRDGAYVKGTTAAATTAHRVAYRYNAKGELVTLLPGTPSAQQQQTFAYDGLSRLTSTTDGRGQTTSYTYDAMDRVTYTTYADGRVVNTFYGDAGGNGWLKAVEEFPSSTATTPDRATDYIRDGLGRLKRTEAPEDVTAISYDLGGNLTSYTDNGGVVSYGYNEADQLTSLALPGGSCTGQSLTSPGAASTKCVLFAVDDDGRRTATRYPGGQTMATTLDDAGRLKQVIGTTLAGTTSTQRLNLAYTYTDAAAPTSATNPNKDTALVSAVTDAVAAAKTTYSHDTLDRLTAASTAPTAGGAATRYEGFCYDGAGNRTKYLNTTATTCTTGTPVATFTYNGGNELTTATGVTPTGAALAGTGYSYDANGNQTSSKSATGLTTAYGAQEQASSFAPAAGSAITQKYGASDGGNGERVLSGSTGFAASPLSPAPAWSKTGTTSTWAVRDPSGTLIAVRIGSSSTTATEYYPFTDNAASVRALVKADGALANNYSYSAYGVTLTSVEAAGASQPYRYGGGYTDTATALIKLGIRYYDPTQGRFTQQDPTGQDPHYLYAAGTPTTYIDPSGNSFKGDLISGLAGTAIGAATDAVLGPVVGGAIAGCAGGVIGAAIDGGSYKSSCVQGAAIGAASAGLGSGIKAASKAVKALKGTGKHRA